MSSGITIEPTIVPTAGGGGAVQAVLQWQWDTTNTEADPGSGLFRMNNDAWASVTQIMLDDLAAQGIDASTAIENWQQGGILMIQQTDDADAAAIFTLDSDPVDDTGYYDLAVTYVSDSGTAPTDAKSFTFVYQSPIPVGKRIIQDTGPIEYDPSAAQALTTTHADVDGSDYSFTPVSSTSEILYKYIFVVANVDASWNCHTKLLVDGVLETESETNFTNGDSGVMGGHTLANYAYPIQSWGTSAKTIKMQAREYGASNECKLHESSNWDGAGTAKLRRAILQITEYE